MSLIGNLIWFIFAGLWSFITWTISGILLCLSIVGIPLGLQCFKIASFGLFPFGKEVVISSRNTSLILNIIWIVLFGWELAIVHLTTAFFLCITIIGIPFAKQCLKLTQMSLFPFGIRIVKE
ncbi:YccF domain-containing protein [Streptococcus pluranimalium]|uniref:Membrane protein n=1 Tax=Streptococcus agalactiae LMG 14747 TaxID=1154860 RepID=V6Z586_STRAG|nr:YccF domain-containing protein [Streptococcus hyovaginalis]ESV55431.1 membrane protein [Streptococcus agalactiae LMG 14747]MDY3025069.1 YccF domain-containing protein [Streptococcus hyovaginalis]MDY4511147.1 YccF domain-containing protein [Streptococcus hyovaginalis]MDY5973622.1 YccF domain-containing protein [Streptococcus hyovaginalis]